MEHSVFGSGPVKMNYYVLVKLYYNSGAEVKFTMPRLETDDLDMVMSRLYTRLTQDGFPLNEYVKINISLESCEVKQNKKRKIDTTTAGEGVDQEVSDAVNAAITEFLPNYEPSVQHN